ncbi:MAG: hypothetical protein QM571_06890 [Micrococcaceae bacterium]
MTQMPEGLQFSLPRDLYRLLDENAKMTIRINDKGKSATLWLHPKNGRTKSILQKHFKQQESQIKNRLRFLNHTSKIATITFILGRNNTLCEVAVS